MRPRPHYTIDTFSYPNGVGVDRDPPRGLVPVPIAVRMPTCQSSRIVRPSAPGALFRAARPAPDWSRRRAGPSQIRATHDRRAHPSLRRRQRRSGDRRGTRRSKDRRKPAVPNSHWVTSRDIHRSRGLFELHAALLVRQYVAHASAPYPLGFLPQGKAHTSDEQWRRTALMVTRRRPGRGRHLLACQRNFAVCGSGRGRART